MDEQEQPERFQKDLHPDTVASLSVFNACRNGLYDWMSMQRVDLPDFQEVKEHVEVSIGAVSESFSESAISISKNEQSRMKAGNFIRHIWMRDEFERVRTFSELVPDVAFSEASPIQVSMVVQHALSQPSLELSQQLLYQEYCRSLGTDVAWYFAGVQQIRAEKINTLTENAALSLLSPRRYYEPDLKRLLSSEHRYAKRVLARFAMS